MYRDPLNRILVFFCIIVFGLFSITYIIEKENSEFQGVVTVYSADGNVIKIHEGTIRMSETKNGIVRFSIDGQEIMYCNCQIEIKRTDCF